MKIGALGGRRAAGIDGDDARAALLARLHHALKQHRMAPGGIRSDEHDQVGLVEVFVAAWHRIGAEGPPVPGDRGGHAEPRIGVDIGGAEKAFHQLVGDVIILGQQLARKIERDGVRTMPLDGPPQSSGDAIERGVPCRARAVAPSDAGAASSSPSVSPSAAPLEQRRPKFAGWPWSPGDDCAAGAVRRCHDAAADTAIRACRLNARRLCVGIHQ